MADDSMLLCLRAERRQAEYQAWKALGRYKFQMFGYWAATWVHLNRLLGHCGENEGNPFGELVQAARRKEA